MRKPLRIFVFNVGQGDNLLLHFPNNKYGIIDLHHDSNINYPNEPPVLTYLQKLHQEGRKIDIAFIHISHYHEDHIKGLNLLLYWIIANNISVDEIWLPALLPSNLKKDLVSEILMDSPAFLSVLKGNNNLKGKLEKYINKSPNSSLYALENYKKLKKSLMFKVGYLSGNNSLPIDKRNNFIDQVTIESLAPSSERATFFAKKQNSEILKSFITDKSGNLPNKNDISVVLKIEYGGYRMIFGGDAERSSINEIINNYSPHNLCADFIKIFHHGSHGASSKIIWQAFIREESEVIAAISSGKHKGYNHPDPIMISQIKNEAKVFNSELRIFTTKSSKDLDNEIATDEFNDNSENLFIPWKKLNPILEPEIAAYFEELNIVNLAEKENNLNKFKLIDNFDREQFEPKHLGHVFDFHSATNKVYIRKLFAH